MKFCSLLLASSLVFLAPANAQSLPDTLIVPNGSLRLKALVWRPQASGPLPVVLFAHGSGCSAERSDTLGRTFSAHGFIFVYLARRGHGLSASEGECLATLMNREQTERGDDARARLQFRLMTTDHFSDFMAGLAFVKSLPGVDRTRVVVAGHSFGGQLALLAAEQDSTLKAALDFAGAANSWSGSIELQERLLGAVERSVVPTFIAHAANDISIEPGKALAAVMERQGRAHRLIIYPPFGATPAQGHAFIFLAPNQWEPDVFQFLAEHVPQ